MSFCAISQKTTLIIKAAFHKLASEIKKRSENVRVQEAEILVCIKA